MTNQNNTLKKDFHFRSKFAKLLNEKNHSIITNAFKKFCYEYDSDCAGSFLWKLTYDAEISSPYLLSDIGLYYNIISDQNILLLRNELRYQYQQHINKNFLAPTLHGSCKEAFDELHHQSDIVIANVVYQHCINFLKKDAHNEEINRILYLLSCIMDNMHFGGIRALGFDMLEAAFLKPLHKLIYNLLIELYNDNKNTNNSGSIKETQTIEVSSISEKTTDISTESISTKNEITQFKPLSPENILLHKDIFSEFASKNDYNILLQIGKLEFDLNKVMIKKDKIADFLKAAEALNE